MSLQHLRAWVDAGVREGGLAFAPEVVDSPRLATLLGRLCGERFALEKPEKTRDDAAALAFRGTLSTPVLAAHGLRASFEFDAGGPETELRATFEGFPAGWSLGTALPDLAQSFFATLALSDVRLSLDTRGGPLLDRTMAAAFGFPAEPERAVQAALHGLSLEATAAAEALPEPFRRHVLAPGTTRLSFSGPIVLQDGRTKLHLVARETGSLALPSFPVTTRAELASVLDYSASDGSVRTVVFGAVRAEWPVRGGESGFVPVRAVFTNAVPGGFRFEGAIPDGPAFSTDALAAVLGRPVSIPSWPAELPGMGGARICALGGEVSPHDGSLLWSEAIVSTDAEWAPLGEWLRFHDLRLRHRANREGRVSVVAFCRADVAGGTLEGQLEPAELSFSVQLAPGSRLALKELLEQQWGAPLDVPPLEATALQVYGDLRRRTFGFVGAVETDWRLSIGPVSTALRSLRAELSVADGVPSAAFTGELELGGNRLVASIARDGSARTWRLAAGTAPGVPLDVEAWLTWLQENFGVSWPEFLKRPRIDAVGVSLELGAANALEFVLAGSFGISLSPLGSFELIRLRVELHENAKKEVDWTLAAAAILAIGERLELAGELQITRKDGRFALSLRPPAGTLPADEAPRLAALVTTLVPSAEPVVRDWGDLALKEYALEAATDGAFLLSAASAGTWKLPFGNGLMVSALAGKVQGVREDGTTVPSGSFEATLGIGGATFALGVEVAKGKGEISLTQGSEPLSLGSLVASFAPEGTTLPPEATGLAAVAVSGLHGRFDAATRAYDFGGTLSVTSLDVAGLKVANASGTLSVRGNGTRLERLTLSLSAALSFAFAPELAVEQVSLELSLAHTDEKGWRWHVGGQLAVRLFDLPKQTFAADASNDGFSFTWESTPPLAWQVPGLVEASFERLALEVVRDEKTRALGWSFAGRGALAVGSLPRVSGTLSFGDRDGQRGVAFVADETTEPLVLALPLVPGDERLSLGASLRLQRFWFQKAESWELGISNELRWIVPAPSRPGSDDPIDRLLEVVGGMFSRPLTATIAARRSGLMLSASGLPRVPVPFPVLVGGEVVFDRLAHVGVDDLVLELGSSLSLGASLVLQVPEEVNNLFGEENGRPKVRILQREFRLGLTLDPKRGLGLEPGSSPIDLAGSGCFREEVEETPRGRRTWTRFELGAASFRFGEFPDEELRKWWHLDFGEFGEVRLQRPRLSFNGTDFTASGGFDIVRDVRLPTAPLKWLLQRAGQEKLAAALPDEVAPLDVHVLEDGPDGKTLHVGRFIDTLALLNDELGLSLPIESLRAPAELLAGRFHQLPAAFRDYLDFTIPRQFEFDFALTPATGCGMRLDVKAPKNPLKVLIPTGPGVQGITLRKLSFGETLGGNLLVLDMDLEFDQFDLVTLAASVVLPKEVTDQFTDTGRIQQKLILKNLFFVIIYQTQIPIPIPLWFDRVGFQYFGLEGLRSQFILRNNLEGASIGTVLRGAPDLFRELKAFFTRPDHVLPGDLFSRSGLNLGVHVEPGFLELPKYLGKRRFGEEGELFRLGVDELLVPVANFLKRADLGEVLRLVPLEYRNGALGAEAPLSIGPFELQSAWLFSTSAEFEALVRENRGAFVSYLREGGGEGNDFVQALKQVAAEATDGRTHEGLILYHAGEVSLPALSSRLHGFAGLLADRERGLLAQFHLAGKAGKVVALDVGGRFFVAPLVDAEGRRTVDLALDGRVALDLFGHEVVRARMALKEGLFTFDETLRLFPPGLAFRADFEVHGTIGRDVLDVRGRNVVALPPLPEVEANFLLTHEGALVATRWLDEEWRLAIAREAGGDYLLTANATRPVSVLPNLLLLSHAEREDEGPALLLRGPTNAAATLSGRLSLPMLATHGAGAVTIRPNGVDAALSAQFLGKYASSLTLRGRSLAEPLSFAFEAAVQGNILGDLARSMHEAFGVLLGEARALADGAERLLAAEWEKFTKLVSEGYHAVRAGILDTKARLEQVLGTLDKHVDGLLASLHVNAGEIEARKKLLDELSRRALEGIDLFLRAVADARARLQAREGELGSLDRWYNEQLDGWGRFWNFAYYSATRARLWLELQALPAVLYVAEQELERARQAIPVVRQGVDAVLQQLDLVRNGILDEIQRQKQTVVEHKKELDRYNDLLLKGADELLREFGKSVDSSAREAAQKAFDAARLALDTMARANEQVAKHSPLGLPFEVEALTVSGQLGSGARKFEARADVWVNTFENRRFVPNLTLAVDFDDLPKTAAGLARELWEKRNQLQYDDYEARRRQAMAEMESRFEEIRTLRRELGPQFGETLEKKLLYEMDWTELATFYDYAKRQLLTEETMNRFPILRDAVPLIEAHGGEWVARAAELLRNPPPPEGTYGRWAYDALITALREAERVFKSRFAAQLVEVRSA